jgi:ribosomal protein L37E
MDETGKIAKCARCKSVFVKMHVPVCEKCTDDEEADFKRISETMAENPDQNAETIALLADVTTACVLRMLDRGLITNENMGSKIKCGQCGKPAISAAKKLCQSCLIKLDQKFFSEISQAKRVREDRDANDSVHETLEDKRKTSIKSKKR